MEEIVDYLMQNHDTLLYVLAGLCLVFELTVLGLSGPLLFIAISCALTGGLIGLGLISSWEVEVLSVGVLSLFTAFLLWKPLKRLQGPAKINDTSSDMIGQVVAVSEKVTKNGGSIRHSGIDWQARLILDSKVESLDNGIRVEICAVEGNVMIVDEINK